MSANRNQTKDVTLTARINLSHGVMMHAGEKYREGQPRRFKIDAYDGGTLMVAGFDYPVIVDLASLEIPPSIPLVMDHTVKTETTIGSTDSAENDLQSLKIAGVVTATFDGPKRVVEQHDKGQQWQASIGVHVGEQQIVKAGQSVTVNGRQFRGPVIVAKNSLLFHVGVLPAGADWTTRVNLAAAAAATVKGAAMPTFEDWLKTLNIDQATLSPEDLAALTLGYDAQFNAAPAAPPAAPTIPAAAPAVPAQTQPGTQVMTASVSDEAKKIMAQFRSELVTELRTGQQAELTRQADLRRVAGEYPQILATAIGQNWDVTQTENAVLKEQLKVRAPQAGRGGRTEINASTPQVLEAAICMKRNIPGHEKHFKPEILQAASDQFGYRGIGLQQLLLIAAAQNGYTPGIGETIGVGNLGRILRAAYRKGDHDINAAFTTVSLPGILDNIANKELLAGYESDATLMIWKEIAKIASVSDFKTATSYRLLGKKKYEQLAPGGKIKSGSVSEESYTRQAKTYALLFELTRETIVNDDLGAFDDLRQSFGLGAAEALSEVFWTKFLDNSAFFTSGRGNYITGATTTLLTDFVGLELALAAFDALTSPVADGSKKIGGTAALLVVPPELSNNAQRIYVASNKDTQTVANANIHAGLYRPVKVPWLSDSSYANSSATGWYLLRDPKRYAAMTVSFLDGVEQPTIESSESDFDTLGIRFRGFHDFGCDQAEYLAGVKSKGAA